MSAVGTDWRERARELRAADPDRSFASIGRELGRHPTSVSKLFNPNVPEHRRRDNAQRAAAKRAWENEHDRGMCACGAVLAVGARRRGQTMCRSCSDAANRARRLARAGVIERMWQEGASLKAIGDAVGWSVAAVGVEMARLRREGLADLPYRHHGPWAAR